MYKIPAKHQLIGKLILLRNIEANDYPELKRLLNDKTTMQALISFFGNEDWSDERVSARYKKFQNDRDEGRGMQYVIIDRNTKEVKGNCGFKNIDQAVGEAEYGIIVHKSAWGSGVTKECFYLNLSHGFEEMKLKKIYFRTHAENHRMIGFFRKMGIGQTSLSSEQVLRFELNQTEWPQIKSLLEIKLGKSQI